ncbi:MAG: hypothetical protein AAF960_01385 [Bacteroidota bacterium]
MTTFRFSCKACWLMPSLSIIFCLSLEAASPQFTCAIQYQCPNDTTVVHSVHPDSTGRPIIINPVLLDTLYHEDQAILPACSGMAIDRTWVLIDTNGDTCTCVQRLSIVRDLTKIKLPNDTTFQRCLSPVEFTNLLVTGTPSIYDISLVDYEYRHDLIVVYTDNIVSSQQIQRCFAYLDFCNPTQPPQPIGCQLINLNYPNFNLLELDLKDPTQTNILSEICNENAVHFCLLYGGSIPPITGVDTLVWEYNDDNTGWQDVQDSDFDKFCFVAPPGKVAIDCGSSATGFTERIYRAKTTVIDPVLMDTCVYTSDADTLLICCPIDPTSSLTLMTNTEMCEGDTQTVQVMLNSNDFVENIASSSYVTIDWTINGVATPSFANQSSFNHFVTAGVSDYCFSATVTNCGGKSLTVTECIQIDPRPICGTIGDAAAPPHLIEILTDLDPNANRVYTICPFNDAALEIKTNFQNCIPQWQYSFDLTNWQGLGYSNSQQNTNVLPADFWPTGTDSIYYRISCRPLSDPSACEPCNSDTLKIKLRAAPDTVMIAGNSPICPSGSTTLTVTNPQTSAIPPVNYTWLKDGVVVGTGTSFSASQDGCYWVEASDSCQVTPSNQFCLDVCEVIPIISCPLMPNECAYLGQNIVLSGCDSESSCGNAGMTYQWAYNNGTLISTNGCTIEHLPATSGTTYTLTVTDANGCSATATRFVKPCTN